MFKDGAGATYDPASAQFATNLFGFSNSVTGAKNTNGAFEMFNFGSASVFAQKADNSVAGEMRDCGECHVGGGMMEYVNNTIADYSTGVNYNPAQRTSLREAVFGSAVTAFNALIDIFNADPAHRGDAVVQNYGQTGVLEMDCLICHMNDYSWADRKEAVRKGEFDASRAAGAKLVKNIVNGTTVFYNNTTVKANSQGQLTVDLGNKLNKVPDSRNCTSCHMGTVEEKYQVDWKKRGEMWTDGNEIHMAIGCMGCHERKDAASPTVGTSGLASSSVLGLCDPAKGGASQFEALWNKLDKTGFKECGDCHTTTGAASYNTYGAPTPAMAHTKAGLTAKVAYDKAGNPASHLDLIDCTACHIRKSGFTGGAFVDGTGADEEGRVALHDSETVARSVDGSVALYWDNGKLYGGNLLTSFFWRDMNGLKTAGGGFDANNDGREAGMDPLLQTHVNNINIANGLKALTANIDLTKAADVAGGFVDSTIIATQQSKLVAGIQGQLGTSFADVRPSVSGLPNRAATNPFLPKLSFLLVPFKASHDISPAAKAWGAKGCDDCHAAPGVRADGSKVGGFYNGTYPLNGNMDGRFKFKSDQVTIFSKVNGSADFSDAHPNVVTKKGDRSVPVQILSKFDTPYSGAATDGESIRNIDRSETIYEKAFTTRNTTWYDSTTPIVGAPIKAACSAVDSYTSWIDGSPVKVASPLYCADPNNIGNGSGGPLDAGQMNPKSAATSTLGWLLKLEVASSAAEQAAPTTFRTKQIGSDKLGSVDDIIADLGAQFSKGFEYEIVGLDAGNNAVTYFNTTADTVPVRGNAVKLRITPAAGKFVRLSPQTDAANFGLASAKKPDGTDIPGVSGALWKGDPIVRGGNTYKTRTEYLNYLNSITAASVGIGVDFTPDMTLPASAFEAVPVTATASGVPTGGTCRWLINDGSTNLPAGPSLTHTFTRTGIFTVTLNITAVDGTVRSITKEISIAPAEAVSFSTDAITTSGGPATIPVCVKGSDPCIPTYYPQTYDSNGNPLPLVPVTQANPAAGLTSIPVTLVGTYDQVVVTWGDGSKQTEYANPLPATVDHKYLQFSKFLQNGKPAYNTYIGVYSAGKLVSNQRIVVTP